MRIAVAAENNSGLDSPVSQHFAHAACFALVDVEGMQVSGVTCVDNPFHGGHAPGQLPAFIHEQGANVLLSGGMGQRAVGFFEQYGIQAATGAAGTVRQSVEGFLGGELSGVEPCDSCAK